MSRRYIIFEYDENGQTHIHAYIKKEKTKMFEQTYFVGEYETS